MFEIVLKYPLSYRNLVDMMMERGIKVTYITKMHWVHQCLPILEKRFRKHIKQMNDSWRVDETYIKIKGKNAYL
jgi:transposase, IS6 family